MGDNYSSETTTYNVARSKLPADYRGEAVYGLGEARNLYDTAGDLPSAYVGISPERQAALENIYGYASGGGSGAPAAALEEWQRTVGGEYLNENPYLDEVVGRAVGAAGRAPTSTAVAGGRLGGGTWANAVQDISQRTAAELYGANYQAERNRMLGALGLAPTMDALQYADYARMADVGREYEADEAAQRAEEARQFYWPWQKLGFLEKSLATSPLQKESMGTGLASVGAPFDWQSLLGIGLTGAASAYNTWATGRQQQNPWVGPTTPSYFPASSGPAWGQGPAYGGQQILGRYGGSYG